MPDQSPVLRMTCQWCGNSKHAIQYRMPYPRAPFEAPHGMPIPEAIRAAREYYAQSLPNDKPGVCLVCPRCDSPLGVDAPPTLT